MSDSISSAERQELIDYMWTYNRQYIGSNGRLMVANSDHIITKSRYVALRHYIPKHIKSMHIHHIDGNISNNRKDNLLIVSPSEHKYMHVYMQKNKGRYDRLVLKYRERQERYLRKKGDE